MSIPYSFLRISTGFAIGLTLLAIFVHHWIVFLLAAIAVILAIISGYTFIKSQNEAVRKKLQLSFRDFRKLENTFSQYDPYFHPDIYKTVEKIIEEYEIIFRVDWDIPGLYSLINYDEDESLFLSPVSKSHKRFWTVGYDDEKELFPDSHVIGLRTKDESKSLLLVYVDHRRNFFYNSFLQVAAFDQEASKLFQKKVMDQVYQHSIYRGKTLSVEIHSRKDRNQSETIRSYFSLEFKKLDPVALEDIIIDPVHARLLQEGFVDYYHHRKEYREFGLPSRQAFLLYGPPGTGKSLTCRYVMGQLKDATCMIVKGNELHNIAQICEIARLLQPSLLILEDVDLAFAGREVNFYGTALGEFMDLLDGMNNDDELMFLMTTNEIQRVESAIKDRPGRVNQCLKLDYPDENGRIGFLKFYLEGFDLTDLDLESIAKEMRSVSQVFIKEITRRAIRLAAKEANFDRKNLKLTNTHFTKSLEEITSQNNQYVNRIIGFR